MEFNTFNHIKMEGGPMGGWPVAPPTTPPHSDKKVNPFMQWAIFNSVQGIMFAPGTGQQPGPGAGPANTPPSDLSGGNSGAQTPKPDHDHSRPSSVNTVVTSEPNRPGVNSVQQYPANTNTPAHYNGHTLHSMLPVDPTLHHQHPQQPQHHTQHPHQQQQQAGDLAMTSHPQNNDTAFPGASHLRPNYPAAINGQSQPGQMQHIQNHVNSKVTGDKPHNNLSTKHKLYTEENGQEQMEMTRRGVKLERAYDCKDCDKSFTREEHLKRHAKSHTDEPVHRCEVTGCTKAYTRKERLTRHYKVAHLGQEPERPFFCNICGKDFQRKEHLTRHQKNLHGTGLPSGGLLGQGGTVTHDQNNHDTDGPIPMTVLNPLNPNTNPQTNPTHHGQPHAGSNNHSQGLLHCTYEGCPKTYSRREHLNRHLKLHMGIEPERPYYCIDCGKSFTRKEHLVRHRRSHTGETPFACPDCSKQFARKEHLKRHMRVHTGEHPYPCSECGRSFGRRERLIKHLKTHGIGVVPNLRQQYQQPKTKIEFKKEPEFNTDYSDGMTHGVFGDQTNQLLRMIAQKGPLSPQELGIPQAPTPTPVDQTVFSNPEVARALSNPEIVRAFSNPDVVKAFALSPPKKSSASPGGSLSQATLTTVQVSQAYPSVTRGPDIANSSSVPPELSKLPSGFSIFPVVASSGQSGQTSPGQDQSSGQTVCASNNGNSYYQAGPSYASSHRAELTTIPMAAWPGAAAWHVTASGQPVNMRSPAKAEPTDTKHWTEPTTTYFRAPFP